MARGSKKIAPLFPMGGSGEDKEKEEMAATPAKKEEPTPVQATEPVQIQETQKTEQLEAPAETPINIASPKVEQETGQPEGIQKPSPNPAQELPELNVVEQPSVATQETKKDQQPQNSVNPVDGDLKSDEEPIVQQKADNPYAKYRKKPKYETHVPHNIRIPKEMRQDMEKIAKKLGIPLRKNTGFFQDFTIDALRPAIEKAKKELGID